MRGWVYIITNKAMPELLKVGYTLKDPDLRAQELGHTGSPHPYVVAFEMLVKQPRLIEQKVHSGLKDKREGKEWFRCSVADAIAVIRVAAGADVLLQEIRASLVPGEIEPQSTPPKQVKTRDFTRTGSYSGSCTHCGERFSVTLTRYDFGARCPNCFKMTDTTEFLRQTFVI